MVELILGGVRSGKSREAQQRAVASTMSVTYLATATADDEEMKSRIEHHQGERPAQWRTLEEPLHLTDCLINEAHPNRCIIVDCLTLWLSNWLMRGKAGEREYQGERDHLLQVLPELEGRLIFVSNETNQGVIPVTELARRFCDEAGHLHQRLAAVSDRVSLMVAGIALDVKKSSVE